MLLAFQMDVRILTAIAWCGWRGRASRLEEAHQIDEWCVYLLFLLRFAAQGCVA